MHSSRIPSLILAHASLLAACRADTPTEKHVFIAPEPTAPPSASATTTASTQPSASAVPSAVASTTKHAKGAHVGESCDAHGGCAPGLYCQRAFDGARFLPGPGTCVDTPPIYEGRPLVTDGDVRVASLAAPGPLAPWAERMCASALEEHASIAAFARTLCELMALGAPLWLLDATEQALADEVRHARETFAWVARLGGGQAAPAMLREATSPFRADGAEGLFRDVFRGGAIGETLAATRADQESAHAPLPELGAFYGQLAHDEARHAALAFQTLAWLLGVFPGLRPICDEEMLAFRRHATPPARSLVEPLFGLIAGALQVS
jgi:hypothetical protein